MADTQNSINPSKNDWNGAYVPKHTAKLIKAGIENGTAPFIPNNGQISASPIYNINTGYVLDANSLIPVILTKAEKGYESNFVGTYGTVTKTNNSIKENEKGIFYNFVGKNDGEFHHSAYYFGEQMENPKHFAEIAAKVQLKTKQNLTKDTLKITSAEPVEYLGTYIAACKSGAKIEVAPEVAEQFKANIVAIADNELVRTNAEKNPDLPKVSDFLFDVEKKASEIVKNREKELGIGQKKEQQQNRQPAKKHERKIEKEMSVSF